MAVRTEAGGAAQIGGGEEGPLNFGITGSWDSGAAGHLPGDRMAGPQGNCGGIGLAGPRGHSARGCRPRGSFGWELSSGTGIAK